VPDRSIDLLRLLNRPERASREPRRRIGGLVVALAVLCSAGEAVLRVAPSLLAPEQRIALQQARSRVPGVPDPLLGARSAPNLHQTVYTPDFEYRIDTDAQGFPNGARPEPVDAVLLGSSSVSGMGVDTGLRFWARRGRGFPEAGFLDLGLPAAGPEQQYRVWREHAAALRPRLVVSVLWVAGDFEDAVRFEQWLAAGGRADYDALREPQSSGVLAGLRAALRQSYLVGRVLHAFEPSGAFAEQVETPRGTTLLLSLERQRALAQGLVHPAAPQLAQTFLEPFELLAAEVRAAGGTFLLVLLPSKEELYGAARAPAVLRRIEAVRGQLGALPVLDLYPALGALDGDATFFAADPHLNLSGHARVADELERWLRDSGALGAAGANPPPQP